MLSTSLLLALLPATTMTAAAVEPAPVTIWSSTTVPRNPEVSDGQSVELGLRFSSSTSGSVTQIRAYVASGNEGPHPATLWSPDGKVLARTVLPDSSQSGWRTAVLSQPVSISAGRTYTVSYSAPNGHYAAESQVFSAGKSVTRAPLTAISGVYSYEGGYPTSTWSGTNYFVDVAVVTDSAAPAVPAPPATGSDAGCTVALDSCSFPDAASTGPSGALKQISGNVVLSRAGQVLENVSVSGRVTIDADNVTLRNVRIETGDYWVLMNYGRGTVVEDSTLIGGDDSQASIADIDNGSLTGRRLDISGAADGAKLGSGSAVYDSYIHDLANFAGAHNDGIEVTNSTGVKIVHNTVLNANSQTSAIMLSDFSPTATTNVLVSNNLLAGGGYTVYGDAPAEGTTVVNNVFSTRYFRNGGSYGPRAHWPDTGSTWSGNVWGDGAKVGQPVVG